MGWCDWVGQEVKPVGAFLSTYQSGGCEDAARENASLHWFSKCEAFDISRNSKMIISFAGDSPTTDRIFQAFDTLSVIVVLSHELQSIVRSLPFGNVVPWADILVVLDTENFTQAPMRSI